MAAIGRREYHCYICDLTMNTKSMEKHLDSDKHKKAVERMNILQQLQQERIPYLQAFNDYQQQQHHQNNLTEEEYNFLFADADANEYDEPDYEYLADKIPMIMMILMNNMEYLKIFLMI